MEKICTIGQFDILVIPTKKSNKKQDNPPKIKFVNIINKRRNH